MKRSRNQLPVARLCSPQLAYTYTAILRLHSNVNKRSTNFSFLYFTQQYNNIIDTANDALWSRRDIVFPIRYKRVSVSLLLKSEVVFVDFLLRGRLACYWSFWRASNMLDTAIAIATPSVRLSVTLVIHAKTVLNIEIWFAPHDTLMLENCCSTGYDVMVP